MGNTLLLTLEFLAQNQQVVDKAALTENQFGDLSNKLIELIGTLTDEKKVKSTVSEDAAVIEYAMNLLVPILLFSEKLITAFYKYVHSHALLASCAQPHHFPCPTFRTSVVSHHGSHGF